MRCEVARERLSAAQDGELDAGERGGLDEHVAACAACADFAERLSDLRRSVRMEAVGAVPDLAPAVVAAAAASQRRRRWRDIGAVAAAFVAATVAGAAFVGLDGSEPAQVLADVPERVIAAQTQVSSLTAEVEVVERGWHPDVPERRYDGELAYRAPESLSLRLTDRTSYPDGRWVPNDIEVVARDETWWARGPAPCPAADLPDCADAEPRTQVVTGREPFRAATPAPLDLVVPERSFALSDEPPRLGQRVVAGREAIGIAVTAAQTAPLLEGLRQAGTLREVHPADPVELWLDADALVPLAMTVRASEGAERAQWAARHGYDDEAGQAVLEMTLASVALGDPISEEAFADPPRGASVRDAGFVDDAALPAAVEPGWLPDGMQPGRAGLAEGGEGAPEVHVASWSDGRAWLKVRATTEWNGERLFGRVGDAVRRVDVGSGVAYVGEGGRTIALHGDEWDVVVTGSVGGGDLLRVAESLGVHGEPVPRSWPAAGVLDVGEAVERVGGALRPPELDGFAPAAARVIDDTLIITATGPGDRSFVLTQPPEETLSPPIEPDVRGVEVRGTAGRYTPGTGELEWVEGDRAVSLRSRTLSLGALVRIAERLEPVR